MQKEDLKIVLSHLGSFKNLDYIACWFKKASDYILNNASSFCFVSTNSICQGEQVHLLWPHIFKQKQEISFAYLPFAWVNSAKDKAKVIVIIVGVRHSSKNYKKIITKKQIKIVKNISPYLIEGANITIPRRAFTLSNIPKMVYGNKSTDDGNLFLSTEEYENLINEFPNSLKFIKKLVGSVELIRGIQRYCFWINDDEIEEANKIPFIRKRLLAVKDFRLKSKAQSTIDYAAFPNRFKQRTYKGTNAIVIPRVSSQKREYIPFGFVDINTVVLDSAQAVYDAELWILSVLLSNIHNLWVKITSGRLKSDIRYSSALSYNNFPFPDISKQRKEELTQCTLKIIDERLKHSEKTLAQLYDPDKMPEGLKEAHNQNDLAVERCYRSTPFNSDEERLEYLFKLYEKMIQEEKDKDTLFAKEKKTRKRK